MHLGFSHRALVVTALMGGAAGWVAPPGSFATSFESMRGNTIAPSLETWAPEVKRVFEQENRHSAYSAEIHYDLGLYFYEQGQYDLALTHYRRATEIDPSFPEAFFGIGLLFYTLGDDENAIRYYEESIRLDPRDADTRNNLGLIYYRRGELASARSQIEEAIRIQPNFPDAFYNLGLVQYQERELDVAVTSFLAVLNQDPQYLRARFNLGVVYFELGLKELAREQWDTVLLNAPNSPLAEQALQNLAAMAEAE